MSSEVERLTDAVKAWVQDRLAQIEAAGAQAAAAQPAGTPGAGTPGAGTPGAGTPGAAGLAGAAAPASGEPGPRRPWPSRASRPTVTIPIAATAADAPLELARRIDHTLLRADATHDEIERLCDEARQHHFASVCVNSHWVPLCAARLSGSDVMVCTVVGFPLGAASTAAKAAEAREATAQGAREIDMVLNLGALKSKDYQSVLDDIAAVVDAAGVARVKVILETSALDRDEKIIASALAKAAGAAFVKTSTGFGKGGATVEDVALMRAVVGPDLGVKASGGVRTVDDARRMIQAGADRIGASSSVAIVTAPDPSPATAPVPGTAVGDGGPSSY